jgi:glucose/mannose-6-phosphate isomerase
MNNQDIDKSNLRRVILSVSEQFQQGFDSAKDVKILSDFSHVMVSGMGGSALPVDVLKICLNNLYETDSTLEHLDVHNNRTYNLPPIAYKNCLNIICSHSGNTEETISSFQEAIDNHLPCVGISAGGKIEQMCKENNIQHIKLPIPFENFQPRMATGHFFAAMLQILVIAGKVPDHREKIVNQIAPKLHEYIEANEDFGREIAQSLVGTTPVIYASNKFRALAMIWKIKINENSKVPAFWNRFPEVNHNEFVGFTNPQCKFKIVMLKDSDDHPRNLMRYDITAKALKERGVDSKIIEMQGENVLEKIFSTIALCDWVSYYLALEYEQDPTPVDMVEDFKKWLQ